MFNPKLLKFKKHKYKDPHHNKGLKQLEKDLTTVEKNMMKMMKSGTGDEDKINQYQEKNKELMSTNQNLS